MRTTRKQGQRWGLTPAWRAALQKRSEGWEAGAGDKFQRSNPSRRPVCSCSVRHALELYDEGEPDDTAGLAAIVAMAAAAKQDAQVHSWSTMAELFTTRLYHPSPRFPHISKC